MKKHFVPLLATCVCLLMLMPAISSASSINLVQDSTVSLNGKFHGKTSYISDGLVETGTKWSKKSVWWSGNSQSIEITLNGQQKISSIAVQADSNDAYAVDYWDAVENIWKHAYTAEVTKTEDNNWLAGLDLRESKSGLNILSDKIRISAVSGDDNYSVSEVIVNSAPTPIPSAIFLLGGGLGGLAFLRRRFSLGKGAVL
ncbi:hypothetical protein [Maridesulfovibrio zosterae]|uniref:hypothetical protein n=1 Tax=Maridesulfovibrio zosterae TaxID=82171 RepID=UPI0004165CB2|nr:hypothetical protein [Maridesulfovibrio zosterae]